MDSRGTVVTMFISFIEVTGSKKHRTTIMDNTVLGQELWSAKTIQISEVVCLNPVPVTDV